MPLDLRAVEAKQLARLKYWAEAGWPNDETNEDVAALLAALRTARAELKYIAEVASGMRLRREPFALPRDRNATEWQRWFTQKEWETILERAAAVLAQARDE